MNESITIPQSPSRSAVDRKWPRYLLLGIVTNAAIWGLASVYLMKAKPSYTSDFAVSLPAASSSANVNLPGIGQASSNSDSPYQINSQDPRENYKFLLTSKTVLKAAANELGMEVGEFGQPRVAVISNTTLMKVELAGKTPEEAQNKTKALYKALEAKLDELRNQQLSQQDRVLQESLNTSQNKLKEAQRKLSEYKASALLKSAEQINSLTTNIEQLRKQRAEAVAQQEQANGKVMKLSSNLNLSGQQAADGFILQTDPVFKRALQDYSESNAAYVGLNARFLPNHPAVIEEKAKRDAAQATLVSRASALLGRQVSPATIAQLNFTNTGESGSARSTLSEQLVTAEAERQGYASQAQALDQQIALLENRLKGLSQKESTLEDLQREVRTAEVVFSSTLTRLDLGKSNVSAAYPQIQVFSDPSLPKSANSPKKLFVLAGAGLGSIFCTNGLLLLWLRQRKKRSPKRDSISTETAVLRPSKIPEMVELNSNHKGSLNSK